MRHAILALALLTAASATAQEATHFSAENVGYALTCNPHGFVLTPVAPGDEVLYLGATCDARGAQSGAGTWCSANGGVLVTLSDYSVGFPRQAVACPKSQDLGLDCLCQ